MTTSDAAPAADTRRDVDAVVFDLDGVIRDWNNHLTSDAEAAAGIEPGTLLRHAFHDDVFRPVVTGSSTWEVWIERIGTAYVADHGPAAAEILADWSTQLGTLVPEMVALVAEVRAVVPVAILTNGTTRLDHELDHHGLHGHVDHVVNTAMIGVAKPDAGAFRHALDVLDTVAHRTAFVDDLEPNVAAAAELGLIAHRHVDHATTRRFLAALGVVAPGSLDPS